MICFCLIFTDLGYDPGSSYTIENKLNVLLSIDEIQNAVIINLTISPTSII